MNRKLFLCNTVYQVFVAMWMKRSHFPDSKADIIISDHMNNGEGICDKLSKYGQFENCYFVNSFNYSRKLQALDASQNRQARLFPNQLLKNFVKLNHRYTSIYVANVDLFSQLLYNAVTSKNRTCKLYIFEDGLATYSKLFERKYSSTKLADLDWMHSIIRTIFNEKGIQGNVEGLYLFNPQNIMWDAPFPVIELGKINCKDEAFVRMCNLVFSYSEEDSYDRKYIFMEESFAAEGTPINDIELLEQLAQRVGKENIMVKIHPRNPINRFAEKGFLTNSNTGIPWEVILLNLGNVSDKVFITVGSSSVLNPILIYGMEIQAYSVYNLINKESCKSSLLSGEFWETVYAVINRYPNMIHLCNSIDEIS